jgi:hypothetical protein
MKKHHPLSWHIDGDELKAAHPVFHGDGDPLFYRVRLQGTWRADFEGHEITSGPLHLVLLEVQKDAVIECSIARAVVESVE